MSVLERPKTTLNFEAERERLSAPFAQHSSEAARRALESIGDRAAYYAQFTRDQSRVLRMIVGDLMKAIPQ